MSKRQVRINAKELLLKAPLYINQKSTLVLKNGIVFLGELIKINQHELHFEDATKHRLQFTIQSVQELIIDF
jgi:hypothetical protein